MEVSQLEIVLFLEAPTKQELVALQVANNAAHGAKFKYFDFQYDPSVKKWVCWFEALPEEQVKEKIQGAVIDEMEKRDNMMQEIADGLAKVARTTRTQ